MAHRAITSGRCVVVVRDNRASLVYAAAFASTETTAFAIRHGSGLLRVVLPYARTQELGIPSLDAGFSSIERMCVSVDASTDISTGISATDRARTARVLGDGQADSTDLRRPGHMMVSAIDDCVEPSTTSGFALKLVRDCGLGSAAVVTELVGISDSTALMDRGEAKSFARRNNLILVYPSPSFRGLLGATLSRRSAGSQNIRHTVGRLIRRR
ncbi:3,4-dihydroxy-2-butanone-4-phosphate synthase [Rhodococcus qingshengii]